MSEKEPGFLREMAASKSEWRQLQQEPETNVPENKVVLRNDDSRSQRQSSQFELAFTNQIWDNLSTRTVKAVMNY